MTRTSSLTVALTFVGTAILFVYGLPAYAAGTSSEEATTAAQHAGLAGKAANIATVHTHLHHVVNCLVGPKGEGFDAKAANPCSKLGGGAIPDATDTHKKEMLMDALKTANMGLASADLATAQKDAMNAAMTLKKAM